MMSVGSSRYRVIIASLAYLFSTSAMAAASGIPSTVTASEVVSTITEHLADDATNVSSDALDLGLVLPFPDGTDSSCTHKKEKSLREQQQQQQQLLLLLPLFLKNHHNLIVIIIVQVHDYHCHVTNPITIHRLERLGDFVPLHHISCALIDKDKC